MVVSHSGTPNYYKTIFLIIILIIMTPKKVPLLLGTPKYFTAASGRPCVSSDFNQEW